MRSGEVKGGAKIVSQGAQAARQPALPKDPLGAKNLMKLVEGLAVGFPDRAFGTETGKKSAEWMAAQMKAIGLEPIEGDSHLQPFGWDIDGQVWPGNNVAGILPGTDPKLAGEYIVVAAHHDSQPDTRLGANDNASGCAGVLAIAQQMAKNPPKRSVLFLTFDGEEGMHLNGKYQPGRRGSKLYAAEPIVPLAKTAMLVNMDMIGQVHLEQGPRSQIHQWASRDSFAQQMLAKASKATLRPGEEAINGYPEQHDQAQMFSTDAEPLFRLGVPTVNFLSGRDLDNHAPEDDMTRIIPERIAQYARLANEVVVEAANHPETLQQMGITPGGLMPSYSMIRASKGAGSRVHEEEALRLNDLVTRLPAFKGAARDLVADLLAAPAIGEAAGLDLPKLAKAHGGLLKEPALNAVREAHADLAAQIRDVPKGDAKARRPLLAQMKALQGVEDLLAGGVYVDKIEKTGSYYMQQLPERLADLNRGAKRLGLSAKLDGVVFDRDVVAFAPAVSADRAVQVAKDTLQGLGDAVGIAAFALLAPETAAELERPAVPKDLVGLDGHLAEAAREVVGGKAAQAGACQPLAMQAMLTAQLAGLKGSPKKWIDGFTAKNRFTDFDGFIGQLGLEAPDAERLQGLAAAMMDKGTADGIVAFYGELVRLVLGNDVPIGSLDDLRDLSKPGALDQMFEAAGQRARVNRNAALVNAAGDDPTVNELRQLRDLLTASFELNAAFDSDKRTLGPQVSLRDVKARIDQAAAAAGKLGAASGVAEELRSWSDWLTPFLALEGTAEVQGKQREKIATKGLASLAKHWGPFAAEFPAAELGVSQADLRSSAKLFKALWDQVDREKQAGDVSPRLQAAFDQVTVFRRIDEALATLTTKPSPIAETNLNRSAAAYEDLAGAAAGKTLRNIITQLGKLQDTDQVQLGQKDRGGPLSLVAVRAAMGREG